MKICWTNRQQTPVRPQPRLWKSVKTLKEEPALATTAFTSTQAMNAASFEPTENVTKEAVVNSTSNILVNTG